MDRSFDIYDRIPEDMKAYLSNYGFNFSKKMCEWAVSKMKAKNGKITPMTKEDVEALFWQAMKQKPESHAARTGTVREMVQVGG